MNHDDRWVYLEVKEIVRETDQAFLLLLKETKEKVWVPKSVIADAGDFEEFDQDAEVSVAEWWAEREGLV